jgi:hypothetical protein
LATLIDFEVADLEVNVEEELIVVIVVGKSKLNEKCE